MPLFTKHEYVGDAFVSYSISLPMTFGKSDVRSNDWDMIREQLLHTIIECYEEALDAVENDVYEEI